MKDEKKGVPERNIGRKTPKSSKNTEKTLFLLALGAAECIEIH